MENGVVVTAVQADVEMSIPHSTSTSSTSTTRNRPASKPSAITSPPTLVDFYDSWELPRSERSVRAPRRSTATTTTQTTSTLSPTNSTSSPFVTSEFPYFIHSSSDGSRDDVLSMDDGLDFFDESFFFLDHIEHSGHPASSTTRQTTFLFPTDRNCGNPSSFYSYSRRRSGGSNRGNQQRVYFGSRLKECQLHRMSTIAETTANNEDIVTDPMIESPASGSSSDTHATIEGTPTKPAMAKFPRDRTSSRVPSRETIYPFPTRVHKVSTSSRPHPALPAPKVGMRKILDYILPYPSHSLSTRSATSSTQTQARRKRKRRVSTMSVVSQHQQESRPQDRLPMNKKGKSIVAADGTVIPRTALITLNTRTTGSSSSSEESSLDEEGWIVHGFFEIQKAL